ARKPGGKSAPARQVGLEFSLSPCRPTTKTTAPIVLWKKPQRSSRPKIGQDRVDRTVQHLGSAGIRNVCERLAVAVSGRVGMSPFSPNLPYLQSLSFDGYIAGFGL